MKQTGIILIMFGLATALFLTPALAQTEDGQEKYAEIKILIGKYFQLMQAFIDDCGKTKNAGDYAAAIRKYRLGMEKFLPEMNRLMNRYADIAAMAEPPEELKPMVKMSQELFEKMAEANAKNIDYMQDPAVQEENKKLQEVIANAQKKEQEDKKQDNTTI